VPVGRLCLLVLLLALALGADEAERLYRQARRAEQNDKVLEAVGLYARAAGMRPGHPKYWAGLERLRVIFAQNLAALSPGRPAVAVIAPGDDAAVRLDSPPPTAAELREAEQPAVPVRLRPGSARRSFDLRGDARSLFEQVALAYGIRVAFDPDFLPGASIRFRMDEVTFREAIRALMTLTGAFVVPLDEHSLLVAADTQQKRNELERHAAALLPIPLVMSVEEANEVGRAVQQVLDIRRLAVDANRRQVYVRDTVTRVQLASALYEELARRRAEVLIEIELVSAARSDLTNLGTTLPTTFPVFNFSTFGGNRPPAGAGPLVGIGGGQTLLGIRIGDAALHADWTRAHGQLLTRFQLRATDGLPATLHIGDRYPIVNAIFSPIVITDQIRDLQNQGRLINPFPSFTFEDLGLICKVTPRVHDRREISLTIEAEFRVLAGASINGLPVISTRKFSSAVRLREGQSSLVSGLAVLQQVRTRSGLAPLGSIPLLGPLFSRSSWQIDQSELILSITPRLTIAPPGDQFVSRSYHTGTEARLLPPI
jgi:general secretion pathway protein D